MTANEATAIVSYLEFTLVTWGNEMEKLLSTSQLGSFYEGLYGVLNEMEETLGDQLLTEQHNMGGNYRK